MAFPGSGGKRQSGYRGGMLKFPPILCLLLLLACPLAQAGTVYKVVGPDGRVTFTDRPPTAASAPTPPPEPPPTVRLGPDRPPPLADLDERRAGAKRAQAATRAETSATAAGAVSPALERAVIGVLGMADLVQQTETLCQQTLPTSFARYAEAGEGWRQRNGAVVARARQVLGTGFDAVTSERIRQALVDRNAGNLGAVKAADRGRRISWCDKSMDEVKSGVMDVHDKPALAPPLMAGR